MSADAINWDAIGAIGQILGSLAVFITLGYLAVQMRHAREETRRAMRQSRSESLQQLLLTEATDARLMGIVFKANNAFSGPVRFEGFVAELVRTAGLTLEEAVALSLRNFAWWNYRAETIVNLDALTPGARIAFDGRTRGAYRDATSRLWFDTTKRELDPDAVRYIENLLARPD